MPNLFNSYAGVGTGYSDYQGGATSLYVRPTATTRSGAVIKGLASQTADLLQMQDSTGAILAKVDSVGAFTTNSANGYSIAGAAAFKSLNSGQTMLLTAGASVSTNPHIVMRQSSSQTGDILQIQNSSGTTLSRFDSGGNLKATNVATLNSIGQLAESNSGALFVMGRATAQASSPGLNTGTLYFRDGTTAGTLRLATRTGAAGVEETIVDNLSSTGSTAGGRFVGAGGVNTAGTLTSAGLVLSSTTSPITLNGQVGTSGQVLTSAGAGATPTWTTVSGGSFTGGTLTSGLVLATGTTTLQPLKFVAGTNLTTPVTGVKEYDGTVFYSTANTNPGRALETQSYYYVSNSDFYIDYSGSGASQSMFGGPTTGLTVAAGTTYEFELDAAVQHQYQGFTGITGTFAMQNTGGATVAVTSFVDYGSNTTGFTTATTMSTVRTTGNVTFMAAISSGSRYGIIRVRGILRVTGSGTTKVYPGLAASATNDNTWLVASGAVFKMTPIGNGTVTTVGAWA
jgi:hypothetical protein